MAAPLFEVGQLVFLKSSAQIGVLESIRVSLVVSSSDGWVYWFDKALSRRQIAPVGDANTFSSSNTFSVSESEVVAACDAYAIVKDVLQSRLDQVLALIAAQCG